MATKLDYPKQVLSKISELDADLLYQSKPEAAIDMYCNTIGYLEPQVVINKYKEIHLHQYLARYLERVLEKNVHQQTDFQDYMNLLLNLYISLNQKEKISMLI